MREYLTYAIPQRLLHLLSDRCPWADFQLVEHGQCCAEFESAAIVPAQGEFCLIFTANEKGLFLPFTAAAFESCEQLSDWTDAWAKYIAKWLGEAL